MRQKYKDVTISEVDPHKYEMCQVKYDGIWCKAVVDGIGNVTYYSRNGLIKKTERMKIGRIEPGEYIGELMYGSQWSKQYNREGKFFVFDLLGAIDDPYAVRYKKLRGIFLAHRVPKEWIIVDNYPISSAQRIWDMQVVTKMLEGLVFRSGRQLWNETLLRAKYAAEIDLTIVGFSEGKGKHAGTLGALEARCSSGVSHSVGGGLSDYLRKEIWDEKEVYLGKVFVAHYKKKFDSGKLRHPNFSRWHHEK
tara:strand:+ start:10249 stop:10998 length:750 start_codon:yes stop_codon:yes gene_type:complete